MKPKKRKRHFVLNFFACFLIPVYTISFAGSTEWFGSNFSIIAVTGWDRYQGFLYWGLLAGGYFFVVVNRLAFSMPGQWLRLTVSWLVLTACLALGYALLMLALLVLLLALYRSWPEQYGRLLVIWGLIVLGCAALFLIPGMVSTALEVFFTISTVLLVRKLYLLRENEW